MINILKTLLEKVNNMHEQMKNLIGEKLLQKIQMEMLEIKLGMKKTSAGSLLDSTQPVNYWT